MSYYTPRFSDNVNERCFSSRSLTPSSSDTTTDFNLTSRSCDPRISVRISTRKYAATSPCDENRSRSKITCNANEGIQSKCDATSIETRSDIVPPLDLQSEENYPLQGDYTFSYRKHCETTKIDRKPDLAYQTWLSAKRKILSDEAVRRREMEEKKRLELEERKRISIEKYEQWLENKSRQQKQRQSQTTLDDTFKTPNSFSEISVKPIRSHINEEDAKARLDEWERTKRLQEERRRMKKQQEEQRRRELEEQRRQAAAEAWNKWMAEAAKKPKPVPLNRGIFTLRGTISDIFVNPNEWKHILPNANGDY